MKQFRIVVCKPPLSSPDHFPVSSPGDKSVDDLYNLILSQLTSLAILFLTVNPSDLFLTLSVSRPQQPDHLDHAAIEDLAGKTAKKQQSDDALVH